MLELDHTHYRLLGRLGVPFIGRFCWGSIYQLSFTWMDRCLFEGDINNHWPQWQLSNTFSAEITFRYLISRAFIQTYRVP